MTTALVYETISEKIVKASNFTNKELSQYAKIRLKLFFPQYKHRKAEHDLSQDGTNRLFYILITEKEFKEIPANLIETFQRNKSNTLN